MSETIEKKEIITDAGKQYEVTLIETERVEVAVYKQVCDALVEQFSDIQGIEDAEAFAQTVANWLQQKGLLKE